jgi:hypothetical protein
MAWCLIKHRDDFTFYLHRLLRPWLLLTFVFMSLMREDAVNYLEQVTGKPERHTWKTCSRNKVDFYAVSEFSKEK